MNGERMMEAESSVVVGAMRDDTICVRTKTGRVLQLWKDASPDQRSDFFERVFAEVGGQEACAVADSPADDAEAAFE